MNCLECDSEMEIVDRTYSNINTKRALKGEITGDIYYCKECEIYWLDNYLTGEFERWAY